MTRRLVFALAVGAILGAMLALDRPPQVEGPVPTSVVSRPLPIPASSPPAATADEFDAGALPHLATGFCPAPGEDPAPYPRPQLSDYLNAQDRAFSAAMQAALSEATASPELKQAAELLADPANGAQVAEVLRGAPDRRSRGLDLMARALVRAASSVVRNDPEEARRLGEQASTQAPADAAGYAMAAFAAIELGDTQYAREALRHARAQAPGEPGLAWALARQLEQTVHVDELHEVLEAYVTMVPRDVAAGQLLARVGVQQDIQHDYVWRTSDGITLDAQSNLFDEQASEELLSEVAQDLDEAARLTGTQRRRELTVIVYPGHEELLAVSCVNAWSGALYDGVLRVVGDVRRADPVRHGQLKHEVMHAQLTPYAPRAPFWFNEGLAAYFGESKRRDLLASQRQLVANHTCFPFSSLEGSFQPFRDPPDAMRAYAQSLAMVSYLIDRGGASAVPLTVEALHRGTAPEDLFETALHRTVTADDLLDYLASTLPPAAAP